VNLIKRYIFENIAAGKLSASEAKKLLTELTDNHAAGTKEDIAVIGMSGRFPKSAGLKEFWSNLCNKVNCIDSPSVKRREVWEPLIKNHFGIEEITEEMYELGGYIDEVDKFDAKLFNISLKEAKYMDPWQRLILEIVYLALEDASLGGNSIRGTNTGVFIGRDHACESSYGKMLGNVHPLVLTGSYAAILSSRISHVFDLKGPNLVIDTACSSALVAIHQACLALRNRQCDMAIVGGINIKENLIRLDSNPMERILTDDGMVRTFDKKATGTLISEGAGALILKPLSKALQDKDNVYAVIKGSAVNNDGASKRVATPSAEAQEQVILKAWEDAGVPPETISYIEAHGTGTLFGDPIEINAIKGAFKKYTAKKQFCAIGTVKTNIGHPVAASGMASIMKAILALKNKKIPGNINFEEVNPYIDFIESPVFVNDRLAEWKTEDSPLRCGVNSFGFSGTNCHIVLEEAPFAPSTDEAVNDCTYIFTLSARSNQALKNLIKKYKYYFEEADLNTVRIGDICNAAACGRGHYEERIAFLVENINELRNKINILNNITNLENAKDNGIYYGYYSIVKSYKENREIWELSKGDISKLSAKAEERLDGAVIDNLNESDLAEICTMYIKGANIGWEKLYNSRDRRKVKLPTYPLDRTRCWIESFEANIRTGTKNETFKEKKAKGGVTIKGRENGKYSDTEIYIVKLWAEIMEISEINIFDNFYALGGDSMKAMKIVNLLNKQKSIKMDITELLQCPTAEKFSKCLDANYFALSEGGNGFSPITHIEDREYYPVSSAQKRMYILNQMEKGNTGYNMPKAILIEGKLDMQSCEEVLKTIVKRHETLRTSFHMVGGQLVQKVHKDKRLDIEHISVEQRQITDIIKDFVRPFDLGQAPLMRVGLAEIGEDKNLFIFDIHHIISDGTSMELLVREFMELYKGLQLPELEIQYRDFAVWQNQLLKTDYIASQEKYWLEKLKGEIPVLNLEADYKRPCIQSFEGRRLYLDTTPELADRLLQICQKTNTTLFMVLLAAYNVLLYRYTGQENIIVGSPIAGRRHADMDRLIGMFVNTIVLRNNPTGEKTFFQFLQEVKENALEAYQNQDYQFEDLVDRLGIKRDYSRNPLFDTMFNLQDKDMRWKEVEDLKFEHIEIESNISKFDLTLNSLKKPDCIMFEFEYSTALFKPEAIERLAGHFINILNEIASDYNKKISGIELLSLQEKKLILEGFNETSVDYSFDKTIHDLFREQAEKTPEAVAIVFDKQIHTYKELNLKSDIVVEKLREKGVSKGDVVGLMANRSYDAIAGILGILKVGGVYLPLDPSFPNERTDFMLEDSKAGVVLVQDKYLDKFTGYKGVVVNMETLEECPLTECKLHGGSSTCEDEAYIIYTSGSTGLPKGVTAIHKGTLNRLMWMWEAYPYKDHEVCCHKTSLNFVDSICEIFSPLLKGIPLLIISDELLRDPVELIKLLNESGVTRITLVPSLLNVILETLNRLNLHLPALNLWVTSGEAISTELVRRFYGSMPEEVLLNIYGSSEVSADVTYCDTRLCKDLSWHVPIGRPISNMSIYILDENMKPIPIGASGEIYISGTGLAKGYLNRSKLTSEKFLWTNLGENKSIRLYKSGDMARYLPDGTIEYLGRKDSQVKIRGYRIETDEINTVLCTHENIKQSVVSVFDDISDSKQLAAYLVLQEESGFNAGEMKEYLRAKLPEYMVPSAFVLCKEIPLLPNGKVNKKLLSVPETAMGSSSTEYVPAFTPIEKELEKIWISLLGKETIGINDNFFDSGGNSLIAMQLVIRVQDAFGVQVGLRDLLIDATIRNTAEKLEEAILAKAENEEIDEILTLLETMDEEQALQTIEPLCDSKENYDGSI
jgi:amino acid adenylation domain-containing protein